MFWFFEEFEISVFVMLIFFKIWDSRKFYFDFFFKF